MNLRPRQLCACLTMAAVLAGCAIPTRTARLEPTAAPSPVEEQAQKRLEDPACSPAWSWVLPGLGQLCMGKTGEGAVLTSLVAAELGAAVALSRADLNTDDDGLFSPELLPLATLQNLWMYGVSDIYLEEDRAQKLPFTPQDTLGELVAAPFNLEVLSEPDVWGGIIGLTAAAFAFSALGSTGDDRETSTGSGPDHPSYFGQRMHPGAAYPLAFATGTFLFSHVAIGEETLFRGVVQSSLARNQGEWAGWAWGSVIFGAIHIPNALVMPAGERSDYLTYSLPFITAVGSYLGLSYKWNDYSLAHPVALHFWYDFLLSAAQYAVSPGDSPIGMSFALPF